MTVDVLICGAGPVGMTLAAELARYGVSVRVIDASAARSDKSKALVLWSRSLELFEASGLSQQFVTCGNPVSHAGFYEGQTPIGALRLDTLQSRYAYALMIPQTETERLLEAHLAAAGIRIERNSTLAEFSQGEGSVTARIVGADGASETVTSRWLVGCDGAHSTVRHQLGLSFDGYAEPIEWALADVHLPDDVPADRLQLSLHPAGVIGLFPMGGHRFRLIVDLGVSEDHAESGSLTLLQLQAMIDERGRPDLVARDPVWLSRFRINERKVADYRRGRIFLAGDAAHIHSPAGGQGMNTGMQDAFNLAWKLALVAKGAAGERLLETYSLERSPVADIVLRNAGGGTRAITLSNGLARRARNMVLGVAVKIPAVQRRVGRFLSELDVAYPKSPLSVAGANAPAHDLPSPGGRVDPLSFGLAQRDIGADGRFTAIGAEGDTLGLRQFFPGLIGATRDIGKAGLWLIRPDGYLGYAGASGDLDGAGHYLKAIA